MLPRANRFARSYADPPLSNWATSAANPASGYGAKASAHICRSGPVASISQPATQGNRCFQRLPPNTQTSTFSPLLQFRPAWSTRLHGQDRL